MVCWYDIVWLWAGSMGLFKSIFGFLRCRYFLISISGILLCACSTQQIERVTVAPDSWYVNQSRLAGLDTWEIKGRISVQIDNDAMSGSLVWEQEQHNYALQVRGPLGKGNFELTGDGKIVVLRTGENEVYESQSPEQLLQQNLGWQVPLSGLVYWIRGMPQPGEKIDTLVFDAEGRTEILSQLGWNMEFDRYVDRQDYVLPGRVELSNNHLKIKLVIRNWQT